MHRLALLEEPALVCELFGLLAVGGVQGPGEAVFVDLLADIVRAAGLPLEYRGRLAPEVCMEVEFHESLESWSIFVSNFSISSLILSKLNFLYNILHSGIVFNPFMVLNLYVPVRRSPALNS